ncbi:MAG: GatB/YqeY domain-containing protein [Imperialibacter sp.]|uniref:GatB/YqeY domain-containing protein n=1 Tax=Imperialibacter sp. TaxID=2038411 RepID=UPI0032EF4804
MSLKTQIDGDIKQAMLSKNPERLRALRAIKSLILLAESEKGAKAELDQAAEMAILTKAAKQRKDSLAIFEEQNRPDLAEKEQAELDVINEFLPKQLSEEEVKSEVAKIIAQVGASGPQDMGKVMGAATKALAGKADGKMISTLVKELLSK